MEEDGESNIHHVAHRGLGHEDYRREKYQSQCYRVVDPQNVCVLDDTHGYLYGFVSPIDGAKLSEMAFNTLQVLNYIINTPPNGKCILDTPTIITEMDKKDDVLRGLKRVSRNRDPLEAVELIWRNGTIDELPRDCLCTFRTEEERDRVNEEMLPLGEIFLSPVHVKRFSHKTGEADGKGRRGDQVTMDNFWLVLLKTRRSFDFVGHIREMLVTLEKKRRDKNSQYCGDTQRIMDKLLTVIQYQCKMSPAARYKLQEDVNARQYVLERFHLPEGHDTMDEACNIYECFRSMQHPYWRDDETRE